jgi:CubicO group peptidase (beta-lactamase class C family)
VTSRVNGFAQERFSKLAESFAAIIDSSQEAGAAVSVWYKGEDVVDLWGGFTDRRSQELWREDSAAVTFSCTKGLMSLALAHLYEAGELDYQAPVTKYWPEYGRAAKSGTTVRDLVAHRAGVPFFARDITAEEVVHWQFMTALLEEEDPLWRPGDSYAYHAITHGWLVGELIRRISGLMPGEYLAKQISGPLGASTWLGISDELDVQPARSFPRADLVSFSSNLVEKNSDEGNFLLRSLTLGSAIPVNLVGEDDGFNSSSFHQAQIPGAGAISTARGLAKIWSSAVYETDGIRTINDATVDAVTRVQSEGPPFSGLGPPYGRFGMGFQLDSKARRYLTESSFGHDGAGGQCAFADPEFDIGFAFITTEMGGGEIEDDRATRLINQLRTLLQG